MTKQQSGRPKGLRNDGAGLDDPWIVCADYQGQGVTVLGIAPSKAIAEAAVQTYKNQGHNLRFWCYLWNEQWAPYIGKLNPDDAIRYQYPIHQAASEMAEQLTTMSLSERISAGHFNVPPYLHDLDRSLYNEIGGAMWGRFKWFLADELGMKEHPKFEALYAKAYSMGHGSGMHEVLNYAHELVDLVK